MTDNITYLHSSTTMEIPPDRVLENAPRDMKSVVVIGYDGEDGFYFASSIASLPEVNWLLDKAKLALLDMDNDP